MFEQFKISEELEQTDVKERQNRQWRTLFPAMVFSILCYAGFMFSNPLYLSTDSIGVAIVVDGYYGTNNFCQYIHPLLCLLIRLLTPLLPTADLFTLLIHFVIILQIGILFLIFTEEIFAKSLRSWSVYDIGKVLAVGMTILLFTSGITIWNTNYTITTGAIVLFGITICFVFERKKKKTSWIIIGAGTLYFGCMLRMESALLFLPFVALEVFIHHLSSRTGFYGGGNATEEEQANSRSRLVFHCFSKQSRLIPVAAIIILIFVSRAVFYAREPYRTAARYNAARTICVDFPMRPWNSEVEDISDRAFSQNDYAAATNWFFFDTDFFDIDMLERIAAAGRKNEFDLSVSGIKGMLHKMRYTLFNSSLYMVILILLSMILAVRNILCSNVWRKAETVLAALGAFIIIMYFTFRGRAPMRVWEPVIFAADFSLLMAALDRSAASWNIATTCDYAASSLPHKVISQSAQTTHRALNQSVIVNDIYCLIIFIILWFSTGQLIANGSYHDPQPVWLSRIPVEKSIYDATVSDTAGEDSLFIWPNWNAHLPQEVKITGRLPSREIVRHNIATGDWLYAQPFFTDFLKGINAENPAAALLNRPNTYLMDGESGIASSYLQEHKENLLRIGADGKTLEGDAYITLLFEPVPELGVIDGIYASRINHMYKGDMAEK